MRQGGSVAERIHRKFFIQYLRRLILEQIEFYYPTVGAEVGTVEKQFFLLFHNSQVMYPCAAVVAVATTAVMVPVGRSGGGVPFDGLKI